MLAARRLVAVGLVLLGTTGCESEQARAIEKSMEPTIRSGEIVRVDYDSYDARDPMVGEIISFGGPAGAELGLCGVPHAPGAPCPQPTALRGDLSLVKRVVAGPGDTIAVAAGGHAVRNGVQLYEPYAQLCAPTERCDFPQPIQVPPGHWFVLGDNRPYSGDSRHFGPIPRAWIEGSVSPPQRAPD